MAVALYGLSDVLEPLMRRGPHALEEPHDPLRLADDRIEVPGEPVVGVLFAYQLAMPDDGLQSAVDFRGDR